MRIENLKKGMRFKSYKELCNALRVKEKQGKSKILQLKEFERYFKWEKDGNAFIIIEVYNKPLKKDNRVIGNNSIYIDEAEKLILDIMAQESKCLIKERRGITCIPTFSLFKKLSMINANYSFEVYNIENLSNDINVSEYAIYEFYDTSFNSLKSIIESALKRLANKALVIWETTKIISINEKQNEKITINKREATNFEKQCILKVEKEILRKMNFLDKKQVVLTRKWNDFVSEVNGKLYKLYNINSYCNAYKLIYNNSHVEYELQIIEKLLTKKILNSKIVNQFEFNAEKRHEKVKEKVQQVLKNQEIADFIETEMYTIEDVIDKVLTKKEKLRLSDDYIKNNKKIIDKCILIKDEGQ